MSLNIPLVTPQVDSVLDPEPHSPPAGDWHDDDGQALASYFLHNDPGPAISTLVRSIVKELMVPEKVTVINNNRIIRRKVDFQDLPTTSYPYPAYMALPADPNRDSLTFLSSDVASNQKMYFGSDRFDALADANSLPETDAIPLNVSMRSLIIPNYTGPVWVAPSGVGAAGNRCQWWIISVTS